MPLFVEKAATPASERHETGLPAPTPTGFAEIVSDDFPILHRVIRMNNDLPLKSRLSTVQGIAAEIVGFVLVLGSPAAKRLFAPLAQLAEQVTLNHWVAGSIPARCNFLLVEARPELVEMGADEVSSINIFLRDRHAAADAKSTAGYLQSRRGLLSLILV